MSSRLNVKLVELEVNLPSIELLLKKYGKYLVNKEVKDVPENPEGKSKADSLLNHQLLNVHEPQEKAKLNKALANAPNTSTESEPSDLDSETELRDSGKRHMKRPKLVLGSKLLQKRKSKKKNWGKSKRRSSGKSKTLRKVKEAFKSNAPQESHSSTFQDEDETERESVPESVQETQFKEETKVESCEPSKVPKVVGTRRLTDTHIEAHHDNSQNQDVQITDKDSNQGALTKKVLDTKLIKSTISEKLKLKGSLSNQFSLKLKELKIVLRRIDDHPLVGDNLRTLKAGQYESRNRVPEKVDPAAGDCGGQSEKIPSSSSSSDIYSGKNKAAKDGSNIVNLPLIEEKVEDIAVILRQSFKCDCGVELTTLDLLQSHSNEVHKAGSGSGVIYNNKCKFCDILFHRWSSRKKHEHQFHNMSKPVATNNSVLVPPRPNHTLCKLSCDICGETFVNSSNLSLHRALTHEASSVSHKCQICWDTFKSEELLRSHQKSHDSLLPKVKSKEVPILQLKQHKCAKCDSRFSSIDQVRLHEKASHSVGAHQCELCDAAYSKKFLLNRHIKLQHSVTEKQWNVRQQQFQKKRPGPRSKTCGKAYIEAAQKYSAVSLHGSMGVSNPINFVAYERSQSLQFNDSDDDDAAGDPLEDPLRLQDENDINQPDYSTNEQAVAGEVSHTIHSMSADKQPSLLALLEGADPNDPSYYADNSSETVTLNYVPPEPESIKCPHCTKTFSDVLHLKQHSVVHFARITKPYICLFPDCSVRFDSSANLQRHRKLAHSRNSRNSMDVKIEAADTGISTSRDGEASLSPANQLQDEKVGDEEYKCKICGEEFTRLSAFVKHEWSHAVEAPVSCQYCTLRFPNEKAFKAHMEQHVSMGTHLPMNSSSTENQPETEDTSKPEFVLKPFECQFCAISFQSLSRYTRHVITHRSLNLYKYKCQYCYKTYKTRKGFMAHIYAHTRRSPFRCRVCQKNFTSLPLLNEHRIAHTNIFSCSYCNKKFDRKTAFESHLILHSKEKLFSCHLCFENFYRKQTLLIHIRRIHSKLRPKTDKTTENHPSEEHPSGFHQKYEITKNELEKMSVNMDMEPIPMIITRRKYPCSFCAESFDWRSQLRQHQEVHKIHRCSLCPMKYLQPHGLVAHVEAVHNQRIMFRCETCDKSFRKHAQLKQHNSRKEHLSRLAKANNYNEATTSNSSISNDYEDSHGSPMQFPTEEVLPATLEQTDSLPLSTEDKQWAVYLVGEGPTILHSTSLASATDQWTLQNSEESHRNHSDPEHHVDSNLWTSIPTLLDSGTPHAVVAITAPVSHDCSQCSAAFTSTQELDDHIKMAHVVDPDRVVSFCRTCNRIFLSLTDFNFHNSSVHDQASNPLSQPEIGPPKNKRSDTFGPPGSSKRMKCVNDDDVNSDGYDVEHDQCSMNLHVTCWACGVLFSGINRLGDHMEKQHTTYTCPYDGNTFARKSELFKHFKNHEAKKSCKCKNCRSVVPIAKEVVPPEITTDGTEDPEPRAADVIPVVVDKVMGGEEDDDIMILEELMVNGTPGPIYPFKCDLCTRSFQHNETLVEHRKIHRQTKAIVSEMSWDKAKSGGSTTKAAEAITSATNAGSHSGSVMPEEEPTTYGPRNIRKHVSASPSTVNTVNLNCDKCYRKFKTVSDFGTHKKSFNHRADHYCPICRIGYSYKEFLCHLGASHPGEKVYSCSNICQIHFRTQASLTRHLNSTQHASRVRMHELYLAQQLKSGNSVLHFECITCKAGFSSEVLVVDHMVNSKAYAHIADPSKANIDVCIKKPGLGRQHSNKESTSHLGSTRTRFTDPLLDASARHQSSSLGSEYIEAVELIEDHHVEPNPEEEQETDVVWHSHSENEDEASDDDPVFHIVTHDPL